MSAIACLYNTSKEPIQLEQINGMMNSFQKFPSDDIQVWYKNHIFLGCHAQWITPESIGEQLPYYDSERRVGITADAIIDNRDELFELLQVDRSLRQTMPDSQLILLAYYKWREESPKYLIGDFAFIIWDEKNNQLFAARDISGYRTLYYYKNESTYAISTTIQPLLSLPYVEKRLNEEWLAEYLAITGMIDTVDASTTPYKNIDQIPPAHSILIKDNKVTLNRFGSLYTKQSIKLKSNDEYVEAFQDIYQKAIDARLRTFKNIGSKLSGGLDSGSVAAIAATMLRKRNKIKEFHTFSYIPPKDFFDYTPKYLIANETPYIQSTVDYTGIQNAHYLPFDEKNSYSEINDLLSVIEMPYKYIENSFWLKGMFEEAHKKDIGVLLNGDRGNFTVSWGSALDYYGLLLKKMNWIVLLKELNLYSKKTGGSRYRNLPIIARQGFPKLYELLSNKDNIPVRKIINSGFAAKTNIFDKLNMYNFRNGWISNTINNLEQRKITFHDIYPWNHGNTMDCKLSLRHALWKRDPTNDLRVVRFCLSMPESQFVQNGVDRALIRRATENVLPDKVRLNQKVRGIQGADWLHRIKPNWNEFTMELELIRRDGLIMDYIDQDLFEKSLNKVKQGVNIDKITDLSYRFLMISIIMHRFLKKSF